LPGLDPPDARGTESASTRPVTPPKGPESQSPALPKGQGAYRQIASDSRRNPWWVHPRAPKGPGPLCGEAVPRGPDGTLCRAVREERRGGATSRETSLPGQRHGAPCALASRASRDTPHRGFRTVPRPQTPSLGRREVIAEGIGYALQRVRIYGKAGMKSSAFFWERVRGADQNPRSNAPGSTWKAAGSLPGCSPSASIRTSPSASASTRRARMCVTRERPRCLPR